MNNGLSIELFRFVGYQPLRKSVFIVGRFFCVSPKSNTMTKWIIDPRHSDVHFKVRHLLISSVTGEFKRFEGTVQSTTDDFAGARITFSAETDSVDTNNAKRDEDLRYADFFDTEKFPLLTFESSSFDHIAENEYLLKGILTIKGVSNPVSLKVMSGGQTIDMAGGERAGFEVMGSVNRYDYGLVWALLTEAGAIILGEEVKIHANIELVRVNG